MKITTKKFNKQLGGIIKEYRIKAGMSIKELTQATDIKAQNFLYEVERGEKGLLLKTYYQIKQALKADKEFENKIKKIILK